MASFAATRSTIPYVPAFEPFHGWSKRGSICRKWTIKPDAIFSKHNVITNVGNAKIPNGNAVVAFATPNSFLSTLSSSAIRLL